MMAGRYFVIPNFQRHFAWKDKQCIELFEDCVLTARNPGLERFMSTITVISPAGHSVYKTFTDQGYAQLKPLLVVDGQQRLTSILILIATICQHLLRSNPSDQAARNAYANFVRATLDDKRSLFRVIPQAIPAYPDLMRTFMDTVVALEPSIALAPSGEHADLRIVIPAQRRILKAREVFDQGIRDLQRLPEREQVTLPELLTCVASRLVFILNTLPDVGQAGAVFEGLNNRGLGLSALESLKAFSIYAVQSFRHGDALPDGMEGTASGLNDDFNNAIGEVYHNLDRVGLPDDTAGELLSASWPLILRQVKEAALTKDGREPPELLDRAQPVDVIRSSLHIHTARQNAQQVTLLETLRFMICEQLVPTSGYFADARRPMHPGSFQGCDLDPPEQQELRELHQRLVDMQCSAPFLPIMLAHRMRYLDDADYLCLVRLIERAAFWVYELGERNKGTGQKDLARLASEFASGEQDFDQLLMSIRAFAVSAGGSTLPGALNDDADDLATRVNEQLNVNRFGVWGAFAYEWLLSEGVELPGFANFVRRVRDDRYLRMVRGGKGQLGNGYSLARADMAHPGNIIITRNMLEKNAAQRSEFNGLPYAQKRAELKEMGYSIRLPQYEFTVDHANQQRRAITRLAIARWKIPEDGRISEPTWSANLHQAAQDGVEADED
jgi:hypothetical protein